MSDTTTRSARYLDDLARMLADLDAEERADVLDGVRDHLDAAFAASGSEPTDAEIDRVLRELGSPGDVARAALAERGAGAVPAPGRSWLAAAWIPPVTVGLLLLGAVFGILVLPSVLLLIGLGLLWASPLWTPGEKLLGTLASVVGILAPVLASLLTFRVVTDDGGGGITAAGVLVLVVALVSLVALGWLAWRGTRRVGRPTS